jgi:hypothetical protein
MDRIEQYEKYHEPAKRLNTKLLDTRTDDELMEAARFLGMIVEQDDEQFLHHESELEMSVHADFSIHEIKRDEKTGVERYYEAEQWESQIEKTILEALRESYTSLFEITSVDGEEDLLVLEDVLGVSESPLELTDIGLSRSAQPGALIFLRPVQYEEVTTTSGFIFPFEAETYDHLIEVYEQTMRKTGSKEDPKPESARRFYVFYRLHQQYGSLGLSM